ncbi:hypothetical protein ACR6HW_14165 [Fusibacter sp. JL298sf-3]
MIVKQKYVGWLGVCVKGLVVNESIFFTVSGDMMAQLSPYDATVPELTELLAALEKNQSWAKTHIELLKTILNTKV